MKNIITSLFASIIFTTFVINDLRSQVLFRNVQSPYQSKVPTRSLNAGCVADVNGDLVDDLYVIDKGNKIVVIESEGQFFGVNSVDTVNTADGVWTATSGDTDNNGIPDIITAGEYQGITHAQKVSGLWQSNVVPGFLFGQGSNLVDINNDGWLDYFVCDDDSHSVIYINDKSGKLIQKQVIDFAKNDPTDGSGNYGSEWIDVNNDMLPDLYIAKCRAGVDDPKDQRRINRLYINKGNSKFEELADSFKINAGDQSWVGTFGDLDNDGDQDLFLVNHYTAHQLFENVEGRFFRKVNTSFIERSFGLQSFIRDYDNDGLQDIVMTGIAGTAFYKNVGALVFERLEFALGGSEAKSMLTGDFNDDGFLDLFMINSEAINVLGFREDEIILNIGNENNFIKISLEGNASNRSGIGCHVTVHTGSEKQVRYVKSGESYGVSNSLQQHFGLGGAESVDSVIIRWPSGQIDRFQNLEVNHTFFAQEGKCMTKQLELNNEIIFLGLAPVTLPTIPNMVSYQWNTGQTTSKITVDAKGMYFVRANDNSGCIHLSKPINVKNGCFEDDIDVIVEDDTLRVCKSNNVSLNATTSPIYRWNTGETIQNISPTTDGIYSCTVTDLCGKSFSDRVVVKIENAAFVATGDTIFKGQQAILTSTSKSTVWYENLTNVVYATGDTITTPALSNSKSFFAKNVVVINAKNGNVGKTNLPTSEVYGSNNTVGDLIFSCKTKSKIKSVLVKTDKPGLRKIIITDLQEDTIFKKEIMIPIGEHRIEINAILDPSVYYSIQTDPTFNFNNLGHNGPRLARSLGGTAYPYDLESVISIYGGGLGNQYYYYFYDWEVEYGADLCTTDLVEVPIIVKIPDATDENVVQKAIITPNPTSTFVKLHEGDIMLESVEISDNQGIIVYKKNKTSNTIDISSLVPSIYLVRYKLEGKTYFGKVAIAR
jgi:hypothetical protein